jgi:hypothetical protein
VSENILDEQFTGDFDSIRQGFIHKLILKMDPASETGDIEDHLNTLNLLNELVEYKIVYVELTSERSLSLYKQYLSYGGEAVNASSAK